MLEISTDTLASIISIILGFGLLFISSFGLLAALRLPGLVSNVLGLAIIAYGIVVLQAQILSELNLLNWGAILVGHAILVALTLPLTLKFSPILLKSFHNDLFSFTTSLKKTLSEHLDLALLGTVVSVAMLLGAYLILKVPANTNDSFLYHLSRVAYRLQNGTLHHFSVLNEVKIKTSILYSIFPKI